MKLSIKFCLPWILGAVLLLSIHVLGIGLFSQHNSPAVATAPGIPPELKKLDAKSYLLSWTDDSVVYVSCYPTVKPSMKPAPIEQTPNRYVITCQK
ncbi:hypothetical protein [Brasilonema sp. UFV-L1]|uniref:hypothetical protein n=1 Tax=Brasilonema sp. UFV-L1 TaxID=2234130 RepID=UPI00145C5BA6|nr:hypothetical protein [Brasilonema sp. UFV-L1]NMG09455.1 hypothetical protein [Brasilonema sp. UFV-L1]